MKSFSAQLIASFMFHPSTAWYLSQCTEARGMQEMCKRVSDGLWWENRL